MPFSFGLWQVTTPEVMMPSNVFLPAAAPDRDGNEESLKQPGQSHFFLGPKENSCQSVSAREWQALDTASALGWPL